MLEKIKRIKNGEKHLLNDFVLENIDYIKLRIDEYKDIFVDYEELLQEGIYIFIKAIYKYDFNGDFKIYCNGWLHTRLKRYVLDNLNRVIDEEKKYDLCMHEYEKVRAKLNKEPSIEELCKGLSINFNSAKEIFNVVNCLKDENKEMVYEENKYDEVLDRIDTKIFQNKFIDSTLTDLQRKVILLRYGFEDQKLYTLRNIAISNNASHQSVDSNLKHAYKKIKKIFQDDLEKFRK